MTIKEAKEKIMEMKYKSFSSFVTALIQIEYNVNEEQAKEIYNIWYDMDYLPKITQIDQAIN